VSRVESDEDVPRYRGKGGGRKRWAVEVYRERWLIWGAGWHWSGKYENERDAREGFRAHIKHMEGAGRHWTGVRLINPEGETVAEHRAHTPESESSPASDTRP